MYLSKTEGSELLDDFQNICIINETRQWGRKENIQKSIFVFYFLTTTRDVGVWGVRMRSPIDTRVHSPLSGPEFQLRCIFFCQQTCVFLSTTGPLGDLGGETSRRKFSCIYTFIFFFESNEARGMFCTFIHSRSIIVIAANLTS